MKNKFNILVTGCGGDIGQSIGKILNEYDYVDNLYGIDISDKNAGVFIYKNFSVGLPCHDENYIESLIRFVDDKKIDLIIPIAEPELRFLFEKNFLTNIGKAKLLTASLQALSVGFDKLKTALFLKQENLPYPQTEPVIKVNTIDAFPVVLKSRVGSGGGQIHVVEDLESFDFYKKKKPDFVVQEYLKGVDKEYTCGVFRSRSKKIRTIILRRQLTDSYSSYGEVTEDKEIDGLLESIANELDLVGSINVQLRNTEKGPIVFEINPRFSSTVLFRHMFGFKDLIWSIEDALGIDLSPYDSNSAGRKFYKGFEEYII